MLDVALINLIAAGIERLCRPSADRVKAVRWDFDREALIRELSAAEPERTGQLIAGLVQVVWQSCRSNGFAEETAESHIMLLADIVADAHLRAADQAIFCRPGYQPSLHAIAELSSRIVTAAEPLEGDADAAALGEILEVFLQFMHRERDYVQAIHPIASAFVVPPPTPEMVEAERQKAIMLGKIQRAEALGIGVPILDVITVSLINVTRSAELRQADLLAAAADARAIADVLDRLPARVPDYAEQLTPVPGLFRSGRLFECDRLLGSAEDQVVRHSVDTYARAPELVPLAIELRTQRACLAALEGAFTKAARHYGFAQRYLSRSDIELRGRFARLEAHYYELAAIGKGDNSSLDNAARAFTSALSTLPTRPASVARARAQMGLGHVLILLGEVEQRPDRFELAAQLLGDVVETLSELPHSAVFLRRARILRGTAIWRLGECHHDRSLIEQAATTFNEVIAQPAPGDADDLDDPAELELGLRLRLALAMCTLGRLDGNETIRARAIDFIQSDLPDLLAHSTPYDRSAYNCRLLAARSHEALARWSASHGDEDEALAHLDRATKHYDVVGCAPIVEAAALLVEEPGDVGDETEEFTVADRVSAA